MTYDGLVDHRAEHEWVPGNECPCRTCGVVGLKLTRSGHVLGCKCHECIGRRNQRKGKRNQALTHRRLGGTGFTPSNEESARAYQVEVTVFPEHKGGAQIPASWDKFTGTEWFRRALEQSTRAVPAGSGALPALTLRSQFCIVDIRGRRWP